jgi:hypothetical protein
MGKWFWGGMGRRPLYHAFRIQKGCEYLKTGYVEGRVEFQLGIKEEALACPKCGAGLSMRQGKPQRRIRTVPIGLKPVVLVAEVPRCQYRQCGHGFEVVPLFARAMRTTGTDSPTTPAS